MSLNLDGDGKGGDIIVITGQASVVADTAPANQVPDYAQKYADGIKRIGMSAEQFAVAYSVAIRVTPAKLRGH